MSGVVPIMQMPVATSVDGSEYTPIVQGGVNKRVQGSKIAGTLVKSIPGSILYEIDGAGTLIPAGVKTYWIMPFNGIITEAFMFADKVGSIAVDIWKCTYAAFDAGVTHPVIGDSICGGNPPAIVAAAKSDNTSLTGWNVTLGMSDVLAFVVPVTSTAITRVTLSLQISRSL